MRTIKKFVISCYNSLKKTSKRKQAYSTKNLLNKLIQVKNGPEILSTLVSDLKSLIQLLKTAIHSITYDSNNITRQLSQLNSIMNLSDDDLQFELQKRLQYYLENKIITPNLMYSVVLGNRVYFNCSFLNNEIPYEVRKSVVGKT